MMNVSYASRLAVMIWYPVNKHIRFGYYRQVSAIEWRKILSKRFVVVVKIQNLDSATGFIFILTKANNRRGLILRSVRTRLAIGKKGLEA